MIDIRLRHQLSKDLRRLITGRMTNDEFDDACAEFYFDSDDLAVREIAQFGWSLNSGDLPMPYRLRGRYAVDAATRKRAAYSVLFLRTENEYDYPETPESFADSMIGCVWFNGSLVGIAFLLIALLAFLGGDGEIAGNCFLIGTSIVAGCLLMAWVQHRLHDSFYQELDSIGDLDIWPFVDAKTLAMANGNNHLLSNFNQNRDIVKR